MENLIFAAMQAVGQTAPDQFELFMIRDDIYGFPIKFLLVGLALITFLILRKNRTAAGLKKIVIASTMFIFFSAAIFSDVWRSHREFLRLCHQATQIEREQDSSMDVNPAGGVIILGGIKCRGLCLSYLASDLFHFVETTNCLNENTFADGHGCSYQSGPVRRYRLAPTEGQALDLAKGCLAGKSMIARRDATNQYMEDYRRSPCVRRENGDQDTAQYSLEFWRQPLEPPYSIITQSTKRIIDRSDQRVVTSFSRFELHIGQVESGFDLYDLKGPAAQCKGRIIYHYKLIERLTTARDRDSAI